MRVDAIRLINFMPFEDTGWMELRPITLLFGRNSSGKSAIIRALLLLKQSLDAPNKKDGPLQFVSADGLVDAGGFQTAVHRQDTARSIIFGFRCNLADDKALPDLRKFVKNNTISRIPEADIERLTDVEFLIGFGQYEGAVQPNLIDLRTLVNDIPVILLECKRVDDPDPGVGRSPEVGRSYVVNSDVVQMPDLPEESIGLFPRGSRGFWTTFSQSIPDSLREIDKLLDNVQQGVEKFLRNIVHLGPIRPAPERVYLLRNTDRSRYEREGLAGWYEFLRDRIDQPLAAVIVQWMQLLGLADTIRVEADKPADKPDNTLPAVRSSVWFHSTPQINIRDVGFGAAQVLPVVAAAVLAQPGSLVIIEQPELHLHPEAQAILLDFFVVLSNQHTSVNFFLETHSASLIYRLRRRIAETTAGWLEDYTDFQVDRNRVSVIFCESEHQGQYSSCRSIRLNERGEYIDLPRGFEDFFGSDLEQLYRLANVQTYFDAESLEAEP